MTGSLLTQHTFAYSYLRSILLTSVEKNLHLPSADDSTARLVNARSSSFKSSGKWSGSFTSSFGELLSLSSTSWLSSESVVISEPSKKYQTRITFHVRGAQILGTRWPGWQNFIQMCLIFVSPQYGICFISITPLAPRIFRRLLDFWKICGPLCYVVQKMSSKYQSHIAITIHNAKHRTLKIMWIIWNTTLKFILTQAPKIHSLTPHRKVNG